MISLAASVAETGIVVGPRRERGGDGRDRRGRRGGEGGTVRAIEAGIPSCGIGVKGLRPTYGGNPAHSLKSALDIPLAQALISMAETKIGLCSICTGFACSRNSLLAAVSPRPP